MQVQIDLNEDQVEQILTEGLKQAYQVNLTFPEEPDYEKLNQAFHVLLPYFMGEDAYIKFVVKVEKKYNSKRLAEAHGGL